MPDQYFAADRALLSFGQPRLRAVGSNGGHCHGRMCGKFAVFCSANCTLCLIGAGRRAATMGGFVHFDPAAGARLPVACAVRIPCSPCCMYDMTCSGLDYVSADSTFNGYVLARLFPVRNMRGKIVRSAAHCAGMPMVLVIRGPFVRIIMLNHGNYLLFNNYFITNSAFLSFGEPGGCAGGVNCRQCDGSVPRSLNYFLLN